MKWRGIRRNSLDVTTSGAEGLLAINSRFAVDGELRRRRGMARTSIQRKNAAVSTINGFSAFQSNIMAALTDGDRIQGYQNVYALWGDSGGLNTGGYDFDVLMPIDTSASYVVGKINGVYLDAVVPYSTTVCCGAARKGPSQWYVFGNGKTWYQSNGSWVLADNNLASVNNQTRFIYDVVNERFVCMRLDSAYVATSADGLAWTATTPSLTGGSGGICTNGLGRVVISGNTSVSITYHSDDGGQTWTASTGLPASGKNPRGIWYHAGTWAVLLNSGGDVDVYTSADGTSWAQVGTISAFGDATTRGLTWDNGLWYASGGSNSGFGAIYGSADLLTWEEKFKAVFAVYSGISWQPAVHNGVIHHCSSSLGIVEFDDRFNRTVALAGVSCLMPVSKENQ